MRHCSPCYLPILTCLALSLVSCARAPESYPPPAQFVMPPGAEPPVATQDPNRLLIAMADVDWKSYLVSGVIESPDGDDMRWCRPSVRFRLTPNDVQGLQFYMRFILHDLILRKSGSATIAISINGRELDRPRFVNGGEKEYIHPVPDGWLAPGRPVAIALDMDPPLVISAGDQLGILLHSIGFKK